MFNDKFTVSVKGNIGFMETKNLPSGTQVTNFTLAINESYKDRSGQVIEETNYANWGFAPIPSKSALGIKTLSLL